MWEGVDGKVSAAIFHTEILGLTAVHAAESGGCIQGAAAAGIIELDAPDFFGNGFVGNMYLEGANRSPQVDVCGGALFVYAQPAVIIKGVGKFVACKLHLLGCADRAVSLSVMGNHHQPVFSFVQTYIGCSEAIVC